MLDTTNPQSLHPLATLPPIPADLAANCLDFLQARFGAKRPPYATADVLVLIYLLWKAGRPWPPRRQVAEHCNLNIYSLDGILSLATARGLINLSVETVEGNVAKRESVVKLRRYTPSPILIEAIET